jgi:hypothetical protein
VTPPVRALPDTRSPSSVMLAFAVEPIGSDVASSMVVEYHYLHRRPPISFAFGLYWPESRKLAGVLTFGTPASRHLQRGMCPSDPALVVELNRLWVDDAAPCNTESWFIARALRAMPPRIVVSYADTTRDHFGYVYRAANFLYAGWTDMERKTPRFDYIVEGRHTREAFRGGVAQYTSRVRRLPKVKYWTLTGTRRDRLRMRKLAKWPAYDWHDVIPPGEPVRENIHPSEAPATP